MVENKSSGLAPAKAACNPDQPGAANSHLSITVDSDGETVTIFTTRMACSWSMGNTYRLTIKDDDSFIFHGDVSPQTMAMLSGTYRAFMYLARWGRDREP